MASHGRHSHIWPEGKPLFRIHSEDRGSAEFNASGLGNARFSPLILPDGTIIPTLYAGTTFACAAMETVFHNLPDDIDDFTFNYTELQGAVTSVIAPRRDLKLLSLNTIGLTALKKKKTDVIETSFEHYPLTRGYARDWHQQFNDIDGLYWTSKQDDRSQACMLFGDRVAVSDLRVLAGAQSVQEMPHVAELLHLAKAMGVRKARYFPSHQTSF